ncbi:VirB4 family type IV secretion/conjugal transfer ATPase [Stenotrophomonas sp. C3(2023)]|uniref:VirB4 family type IV secretion/conjugal transfer ATPase n=1 Tax=Stenotrophomonas sp. C3(2023) TaxID=3080277 RepID=UPI00293C39A0|nr:VirB4 family type IV secretion/conjugal transfer ATPase [Stenotrophomonas sp. C3(2023)]MDV3468445.1 VirB4 family type IV secretion/conjugal transfer ATPase [Stenotrophomonas sp. C3(2023)]
MFDPDSPARRYIPISTHVSPTVLKTTGGDLAVVWRLQGLPFVGRDDADLSRRHNSFNHLLQTLRAPDFVNVAFWLHDIRSQCQLRDESSFAHAFNQQLCDDYFGALSRRRLLANQLYLTLLYRPRPGRARLHERATDTAQLQREQDEALACVAELATNLEAALVEYAPLRLGMYEAENGQVFSEALELFGYIHNRVQEPVPVLAAPVPSYLPVSSHLFSSQTGNFVVTTPAGRNHYGAILNLKEYPETTHPGVLNGLKFLDMEYVITHSFSPVGRQEALRRLDRTRGMMISSGDRAVSQIVQLDQAMDQLASGHFVLGEYHFSMAVYADDQPQLARHVALARAELSNAGFVSVKEDMAVVAAFHAQLPGNWIYRTRLPQVSSLNFLGLSPLHNFPSGKACGNPWGPSITCLQASNGQPYYFNFHATQPGEDATGEKAIGNTLVIGKSGTGKTALINFLLSQSQRLDPEPTIFFFDKDRGAEIFVRACGGSYLALEPGLPTGFNPLQCAPTTENAQFLVGLLKILAGKATYTAREEQELSRAVVAVLDAPAGLRSLRNLQSSLPNHGDDGLHARLWRWTAGQPLGWVFDCGDDRIDLGSANIIGFDYTGVIDDAEVRVPVVAYLIRRLEELMDGRRLIYVMDEFWKILDGDGGLKAFARNKQKTIRKQNGLGIFATQSPEDALGSDIAAALIEQTATLVLLPNPNAAREDYVDGLKLTEAEFAVVRDLDERSRSFLVKQGHDSTVCQLNLRGMDDALAVISASTDNVRMLHQVLDAVAQERGCSREALRPEDWLQRFQAVRAGRRRDVVTGGEEDAA